MYKILYILIFSILLFSGAESDNLDSTDLRKQDPIRLAPVQSDGGWGYINQAGRFVIKPQFREARSFSEGLARVQLGGKWAYRTRTGKIVYRWGYINKEGEIVIKPQFNEATGFFRRIGLCENRLQVGVYQPGR